MTDQHDSQACAPEVSPAPALWASRRARLAALGRRRGLAAALVLTLLLPAGLLSGPHFSPAALGPRDHDRSAAAGPPTGARDWPSWALGTQDPRTGPAASRSRPELLLSSGYRGWAAAPPAPVLAQGPDLSSELDPTGAAARGIYLTGYTAGQPASFQALLKLVESTALNAMVIDIKDEGGYATYETRVRAYHEAGAVRVRIRDLEGLLRVAKAHGVYTIARLVCFNDTALAQANPDLAVKTPEGRLWRDRRGHAWTDPFRPEVWEYNIDLAVEAAQMGFDEIQFDYVRFPTDGDTARCVFSRPSGPGNQNRIRAISEFLQYGRGRLAPLGVLTSADVFGIICSSRAASALGQVLEDVAAAVDYVSPMIYPSHYGPGHFGLDNPNAEPYLTVRGALSDALARLGPEGKARLRPWLQDFTLGYPYGAEEVLDQIRATHELGIQGWLLWNPSNRYNVTALRAFTVNLEAYLTAGDSGG
ncbi:MAG: putative glycoside hydrolase [Bacillota bacterium]